MDFAIIVILECGGSKKMSNYNFVKDLANAKVVEKEFVEVLSKKITIDDIDFCNDFRYDVLIKSEGRSTRYEVKHDIMSCKTGNLALEYECRGKPSGIDRTEADVWVYKLGYSFYSMPVGKLKELISKESYFRKVVGGDSGSNTNNILYLFEFNFNPLKQS